MKRFATLHLQRNNEMEILNEDIKHEGQMGRTTKYLTWAPDKENSKNGR